MADDGPPPPTRGPSLKPQTSTLDRKEPKGKLFGKNKQSRKIDISSPVDFEHTVHVGFDPSTGKFTGMPEEWMMLLDKSGISAREQKNNPEAVIDVLKFYTGQSQEKEDEKVKFIMTVNKPKGAPLRPTLTEDTYSQPLKPIRTAPEPPPVESHGNERWHDEKPPHIPPRPDATRKKEEPPPQQQPPTTTAMPAPTKQPSAPKPGGLHPGQRREPKKPKMSDTEVVQHLRQIVSVGDPHKKYTKMEKIGQGASGTVYTALETSTCREVAIKQMNLAQQPKKELIINEILVMKENKQRNIVNYLDSYLVGDTEQIGRAHV